MNWTRFGLRRSPFAPVPDVQGYVPLTAHEAVVGAITRTFAAGGGLALMDGGPGSGKSLLGLRFAAGLSSEQSCVVVPSSRFTKPADLHQTILFDLGAEYRGLSDTELRLAVTDRLLAGLTANHPTVIVLDEAQHLSDDALEEVRLLGNLTGRTGPAAFILLVAQPILRARLETAGLGAVSQRVAARCRIDPLDRDESVQFIRMQLAHAGGKSEVLIDDEAVGVLATHGRGSPRLLNQSASLAFALTAENDADAVDVEAALEAVSRLGLVDEGKIEPAVLPMATKRPVVRRSKKRKSA